MQGFGERWRVHQLGRRNISTRAVNYPVPERLVRARRWRLGDFNHDGKMDVAVALSGVNATIVSILFGNGDGTLQAQIPLTLGFHSSIPLKVIAVDLNNDQVADLVVTDGATLAVILSNGNGTFQLPVTYTLTGPGAEIHGTVVAADLNGDHKLDIAVTTRDGLMVLLGNGDGTLQGAVHYATGLGGPLAAGDVDNDGQPELIGIADGTQDSTPTDTFGVVVLNPSELTEVTFVTSPPGLRIDYGLSVTPQEFLPVSGLRSPQPLHGPV